jgi:Na+-transporting methylmalonyl-CoA/oxaloacetate decarboxylase gamma subunit
MRQTCEEWPTIATEDAFVENAINGVGMAIVFAFLILLYATGNII